MAIILPLIINHCVIVQHLVLITLYPSSGSQRQHVTRAEQRDVYQSFAQFFTPGTSPSQKPSFSLKTNDWAKPAWPLFLSLRCRSALIITVSVNRWFSTHKDWKRLRERYTLTACAVWAKWQLIMSLELPEDSEGLRGAEQWGQREQENNQVGGWGDFVTGKEKARRRGPSADLVWRWVRLCRSEGHRGISPWWGAKKGSTQGQLNVKGHCWESSAPLTQTDWLSLLH